DRLVGSLFLAVVGARVVSATANFLVNRHLVFRRGSTAPPPLEARRYVVLASTLLVTDYLMLRGLSAMGLPLLPAKIAAELLLFAVSYTAQRRLVFRRPEPGPPPARREPVSVA
ncbi:GtrA family protein, partial [Raoultella terrigena]|uniref:GtrA family protein n=1 Tax=Raoultella terrigena TaxID=577 RepID=UPI0015F2AF50